MTEHELQLGFSDLAARLSRAKLAIVDRQRPWPDRMATYLIIGLAATKSDNQTDIVLSDEFIRDLPGTREYQAAVDAYAAMIATRLRCDPHIFYCYSQVPFHAEITWPIRSAIFGSALRSWLRVDVTDLRDDTIARCAAALDVSPYRATMFDTMKSVVNRARAAVDRKAVTFYKPKAHPNVFQPIDLDAPSAISVSSQAEIERFVAGKVYWLAFRILDQPGATWIADPWDAEYGRDQ